MVPDLLSQTEPLLVSKRNAAAMKSGDDVVASGRRTMLSHDNHFLDIRESCGIDPIEIETTREISDVEFVGILPRVLESIDWCHDFTCKEIKYSNCHACPFRQS